MGIIDNTYFKGEIYIPHATPTVTAGVVGVGNELTNFIFKYEKDCLVKSLGFSLAKLFMEQLDSSEPNGLIDGVDEKWDFLLNGHEYTNNAGVDVQWEGVRRKGADDTYSLSFIADYVYWYYEKNFATQRGGVGDVKPDAKNATVYSPNEKITKAWNNFFEIVQGCEPTPRIYGFEDFGYGIDWFGNNGNVITLYQFIKDMNIENGDDYYPNFSPKEWVNVTQLGI